MKYNWKYLIFTGVILLLALSLAVGTLLFGPSKAAANEQLSKTPVLVDGAGNWNPEVLGDTSVWFSDHFFLRQELISLHNWLSANLFRTSGSESVVLGKDGWLFYADTLGDYSATCGDAELVQRASNNLALMAEYCRENRKEFLFVIAPNKNSLYPSYMPGTIPTGEGSNAAMLQAQLAQAGVPYADLFAAFAQQEEVLYFAHDSHWNSKGAALGADLINRAFGIESAYVQDTFAASEPHTGDLYEMLYPAFPDTEQNPVYGGQLTFTYTGNGKKPDSILLETAGNGTGHLLAYRDSFGNLLYPYLADSYGTALFSRSTVYDLTKEADFVLIELVERNLSYLTRYVPVMPSPTAELPQAATAQGTVTIRRTDEHTPAGCVQMKGELETAAEEILVVSGGTAYKAFLLENGGFSVHIPEDARTDAVYYFADGQWNWLAVQ